MRVIHLLRKLDPAAWGGTEMAIHRLFDGLRERGVTPIIYCPRVEASAASDPLLDAGFRVRRFRAFVPVLGMPRERKRQLVAVGGNLMSFDLVSSLWCERAPAIIHTHTLGRIGGIALTLARRRRVPFVVTIHGGVLDLPDKIKSSFNAPSDAGWEWGRLFGLIFQSHNLFRDADAILTCNEKEAALLRERYPDKRIVVQPHGVPLPLYQQDQRAAARAAFPQIQGRRVLLSLGRIDPIKNQGFLLEQAPGFLQKHPDTLLVLAGACTDEPYGAMIDRRIAELGLAGRVLLTGGLPPNDPRVIGLLQEAAVLLLPSLSETFGLVILEAWAAGTLAIASRTSGASALIRQGENGWLFDLDQPPAFHQALDQALTLPAESRSEMARRGTEKVRQEYSVGELAGRMKRLYEELIEARKCVT